MNENIIKEFQKLVYQIKVDIRKKNNPIDKYRLGSVQNVLRLLKQIDFRITDSDELKGIKGIGKKSLDRVQEILDTGKLSEININTKKEFIKNIFLLDKLSLKVLMVIILNKAFGKSFTAAGT